MGFAVKLDTNGSRPAVLHALLADQLVDYVAMDVKAPPAKYAALTVVAPDLAAIRESILLLSASGIPHQFRTTVVEPLLTLPDLDAIRRMLPDSSSYIRQPFRPEHALDPALHVQTPPFRAPALVPPRPNACTPVAASPGSVGNPDPPASCEPLSGNAPAA
jgi:pyruvate formate lyase activating enzyme